MREQANAKKVQYEEARDRAEAGLDEALQVVCKRSGHQEANISELEVCTPTGLSTMHNVVRCCLAWLLLGWLLKVAIIFQRDGT